jgi:intracellular multiplication protein IcmB
MNAKSTVYYDIVGAEAKESVIYLMKDGSLATTLLLEGVARTGIDIQEQADYLYYALSGLMNRGEHSFTINFFRDSQIHDLIPTLSNDFPEPLKDIYNDTVETVEKNVFLEKVFFTLYTHPEFLPEYTEHIQSFWFEPNTQPILRLSEVARETHLQTLKTIADAFTNQMLITNSLVSISKLMEHHHLQLYGFKGWKPSFQNDYHFGQVRQRKFQFSPRTLAEQLFSEPVIHHPAGVIQLGEQYHNPVYVDQMGSIRNSFQSFIDLFYNPKNKFPWCMHFTISPRGLNTRRMERAIAQITRYTNSRNYLLLNAYENLSKREQEGEAIVTLKISMDTWSTKELKARNQATILRQALNGWGGIQTRNTIVDPLFGTTTCLAGATTRNPGTLTVCPLKEVLPIFPLSRPYPLWNKGGLMTFSKDGVFLPIQQVNTIQTRLIDILVAPMGYGKSVQLGAKIIAMLFDNLTRPYVRYVDVGDSSKGTMDLLGYIYNDSKESKFVQITLDPQFSINIFDLPLGMIAPTPDHRAQIASFIMLLCTEPDENTYEGVAGAILAILDKMYIEVSPLRSPNRYNVTEDEEIQKALEAENFPIREMTSWYELTYFFMEKERYDLAERCHFHAMPLFSNFLIGLNNLRSQGTYDLTTSKGENVLSYISRSITESINKYKIIGNTTQFSLRARFIAVDIGKVAPRGAGEERKQSSVMYSLVDFALNREFILRLSDDIYLEDQGKAIDSKRLLRGIVNRPLEEILKDYHMPRIRNYISTPKVSIFDEWKRTGSNIHAQNSILSKSREGRKEGMYLIFASQDINDFNDDLIRMSSNIYILGADDDSSRAQLVKRFSLNPQEREILKYRLVKPSIEKGSTFLAIHRTDQGVVHQERTLKIPPIVAGATSSHPEDRRIKQELYKENIPDALRRFVHRYPTGSCRDRLESIKTREIESGRGFNQEEFLKEEVAILLDKNYWTQQKNTH